MKIIEDENFYKENEYFNIVLLKAKSDFIDNEYDSCLTKIRTCLEEVFCFIIEKSGNIVEKRGNMPKMAAQARDILHMNITSELDQTIKQQIQGMISIIDSISCIRNLASDSHGVGSKRVKLNKSQIKLCLNSAIIIKEYFLSVFKQKIDSNEIVFDQKSSVVSKTDNNLMIESNDKNSNIEFGLYDSLSAIEESSSIISFESSNFQSYNNKFLNLVNEKSQKIKELKEDHSKPSIINTELNSFADDINEYSNNLDLTINIFSEQWNRCFISSKVVLSNPFMAISEKNIYVNIFSSSKGKIIENILLIDKQVNDLNRIKGLNTKLTKEINNLQEKLNKLLGLFKIVIENIEEIENFKIAE